MVRDFSEEAEEKLLALVDQVESEKWSSITDWFGDRWYDFRDLIGTLKIESYLNRITDYHKIIIDKNNTTRDDIQRIFTNVRNVDSSYATRFAAIQARLSEYVDLIQALAGIIAPDNGCFSTGSIESIFNDKYETFSKSEEVFSKLASDGLTEEDLKKYSSASEIKQYLDRMGKTYISLVPNVSLGDTVEIPLGPGLSFYYSVKGKIDANSNIDINLAIEDQKVQIKNGSVSAKTEGIFSIGGSFNTEDEGIVSVTAPNSSVTFNIDGSMEGSGSIVVDNKVYSVKIDVSIEEIVAEESVKVNFDDGSITTTIGFKKTNDNWVPLPIPVPEKVPVQLPEIDVNWGEVFAAGSVIIIIAGVVLVPFTGGGSLVLCTV